MATAQQLKNLEKARAARKRNLAKKKAGLSAPAKGKKKPLKKSRALTAKLTTKKKTTKPKTKRATVKYLVFIRKNGTRYYLQKSGARYVWDSAKPIGYTLATAQRLGTEQGKKALAKLGAGFAVYIEKK